MRNIGDVIARNRRKKKLSQIDLAKLLGEYDISIKNAGMLAE